MITAGENKPPVVTMDCRDEPGNDKGEGPSVTMPGSGAGHDD
jgi:hypothetical protein